MLERTTVQEVNWRGVSAAFQEIADPRRARTQLELRNMMIA
jgi:hypothetical protein